MKPPECFAHIHEQTKQRELCEVCKICADCVKAALKARKEGDDKKV